VGLGCQREKRRGLVASGKKSRETRLGPACCVSGRGRERAVGERKGESWAFACCSAGPGRRVGRGGGKV
jgi:hypothetical protein